ncbi:class I SAM-dependent methyltransferase [Chloroflexota bacterium]
MKSLPKSNLGLRLLGKLNEIAQDSRPHIPFVVLNTVRRVLENKGQSLLDIGCGDGRIIKALLKNKEVFTIGADIDAQSLRECLKCGMHDGYILCDVRKLPLKENSFDIVLSVEVLEHLEKEDGQKSIKAWEKIARRQVIITTPVGICEVQAPNGSSYDEHKASWYPGELKKLGYQIRGHGLSYFYGDRGWFNCAPNILMPLLYILSVLVGPLVYFFPGLAGRMVCIKRLDKQ